MATLPDEGFLRTRRMVLRALRPGDVFDLQRLGRRGAVDRRRDVDRARRHEDPGVVAHRDGDGVLTGSGVGVLDGAGSRAHPGVSMSSP